MLTALPVMVGERMRDRRDRPDHAERGVLDHGQAVIVR